MMNSRYFREITRRIEEWMNVWIVASLPQCALFSPREDVYLSTPELTIDSSTQRYKSIPPHAFTPPPKSRENKTGRIFLRPCIGDWIEFTRVRSLRRTSQIAIFGIARKFPQQYIRKIALYLLLIRYIKEAKRITAIKSSSIPYSERCAQ